MKNIDRWVVGAAMSFCAARKPHRVFVRLSQDSLRDATLGSLAATAVRAPRIEPARIVFQVSEEIAAQQHQGRGRAAGLLRRSASSFAIENFGAGRDPLSCSTTCPSTT